MIKNWFMYEFNFLVLSIFSSIFELSHFGSILAFYLVHVVRVSTYVEPWYILTYGEYIVEILLESNIKMNTVPFDTLHYNYVFHN